MSYILENYLTYEILSESGFRISVYAESFDDAKAVFNDSYPEQTIYSVSEVNTPIFSEREKEEPVSKNEVKQREPLTFRSDMTVLLHDYMGNDDRIRETARASTQVEENERRNKGLTNMLVRDRHGSPFEHVVLTLYVEAPIFVVRQFQRHRIASFSEESGRYSEMKPEFYLPDENRKLKQSGKPAAYKYHMGDVADYQTVRTKLIGNSTVAYQAYLEMLDQGIALEMARAVLPLNLYSRFFVTMNSRSIMNFLSLRLENPDATFESNPQAEINDVANKIYEHINTVIPDAMEAFKKHGYVAP